MAIRDRIERGESAEQARAAVLREFGNRMLIQESTRAVWVWTAIEQPLQDSGVRPLEHAVASVTSRRGISGLTAYGATQKPRSISFAVAAGSL